MRTEAQDATAQSADQFPVWRTITLGTGLRTANDVRRALGGAQIQISDWGNDILGKPAFTAASEQHKVDLAVVSVADLGFCNGATRRDIIAKGIDIGLALCSAEVGPQLRLQYTDQPRGELIFIAMEPITDSFGNPSVFALEGGHDVRWLISSFSNPGDVLDADHQLVFVRPRK